MTQPPTRPNPRRRATANRREAPLWRQAIEGISMVVAFTAVVSLVGGLLALVVSLLF